MFIFVPLGHDKEITHFPYVTLGIVVLCVVVQAASCTVPETSEADRQDQIQEQRLRARIWREHGPAWVEEHLRISSEGNSKSSQKMMNSLIRQRMAHQAFFRDYEAGGIVAADDPDYRSLLNIFQRRSQVRWPLSLGFRMIDLAKRPFTLISYIFVHVGWFHLVGNMLFLYICGCNMEDRWGRLVWGLFFLGGGAVGALAYGTMHPTTPYPLVGASGAMAAAMGAFLVLHYNAVIRFWWGHLLFLFPRQGTFRMRAFWALPIWMLQQLLGLAGETGVTTVAYSAHVAGFSLGVAAALVFKFTGTDRKLARVSESKAILFSQHPAFVRGMDLLDKGDASGARECFEVVLREAPENTEALVKLAGLVPDPVRAAHLVGRAVMATRKEGDKSTPRNLFIEHQKRHPGEPLSDRVLFAVAECFQVDAPREAISVYEVLLSQHSGSVMAPKAMLNMAIIYRDNLGNPEAARKILAAVQTRYSNSAFAEQAESMDQ